MSGVLGAAEGVGKISGVGLLDKVLIFKDGEAVSLDGKKAEIIRILQENPEGVTAKVLAGKLGITSGGVIRDLEPLVKAGIVEKKPLPVSPNVKLYFLRVKILTKEQLEELQRSAPEELKHLIENLPYPKELVWSLLSELREFTKVLPEGEREKVEKSILRFLGEKR